MCQTAHKVTRISKRRSFKVKKMDPSGWDLRTSPSPQINCYISRILQLSVVLHLLHSVILTLLPSNQQVPPSDHHGDLSCPP